MLGAKQLVINQIIRDLCLKFKILITNEPIGFSILGKLLIGPWMVLGHFIFGLREKINIPRKK